MMTYHLLIRDIFLITDTSPGVNVLITKENHATTETISHIIIFNVGKNGRRDFCRTSRPRFCDTASDILNIFNNLLLGDNVFHVYFNCGIIVLPEVYSTDLINNNNCVHDACLIALMTAVRWPWRKSADFSIFYYKLFLFTVYRQ